MQHKSNVFKINVGDRMRKSGNVDHGRTCSVHDTKHASGIEIHDRVERWVGVGTDATVKLGGC